MDLEKIYLRCHRIDGTSLVYLDVFAFLYFRLFRFTLSQPFLELPLTFYAFVVGENVGEDAPGDVLDFVLRNTGIVDALLFCGSSWLFPPVRYEIIKVQL